MKYSDIVQKINEDVGKNVLYHSLDIDHAYHALKNNRLEGRTSQRYWLDGKRRKDNDPEYQNSFWLKGISTTRSKRFADNWKDITFVLDKDTIANNYEIIPYNWGYSIPSSTNHKRELEEFVVTSKLKKTFHEIRKEYEEMVQNGDSENSLDNFIEYFSTVGGNRHIEPLNKFLIGFYIRKDVKEYMNPETVRSLELHPKFKGYV